MKKTKLKIVLLPLLLIVVVACEDLLFEENLSEKAVTINAPVNNSILTNTTVNFNWSQVNGADEYQIQIAKPAFSNAVQVLVDSIVTINQINFTLESGHFEWRIRGMNNNSQTPYTTTSFSIEPETFDDDISGEEVQLIAPGDGAVVTNPEVIFSWEEVQYAEDYKIQIAIPNFENATQLLVDTHLSATSFTHTLPDDAYQWRVKARNSVSETNYTTNSLTVMSEVPFPDREVIILNPEDNYVTNQSLIPIQWEVVNDATLYRLQIFNPDDQSLVDEQTTTQTALAVNFPDGEFIWQVRAENNTEVTSYTSQDITIDTIAPNTPLLLTPDDEGIINTTQVNFTWSRESIDGTPEKDSLFVFYNSNLTNPVFSEEVANGSYSVTLDNDTIYYWFMKAYDAAGNESEDSDVFSFTIDE